MDRGRVSDIQAIALVALFIVGDDLAVATATAAKKDALIAIILSIILSIPLFYIFIKLQSIRDGKDLFDINVDLLGRPLGIVVNMLFLFFILFNAASVMRAFGEFIITVAFPETPMVIPLIILIVLCILAVKEGLEVLGRTGYIILVILLPLAIITVLMMIPDMDINNIMPVLYEGWMPVAKGALSTLAFPFGEAVTLLFVFSHFKNRGSIKKVYLIGLLVSGFMIFVTSLGEILVLGANRYSELYFPAYIAVSRINIRDFLQRLEILVAIAILLGGFIKIAICLLAISKGIAKIFNYNNYKFLVTVVGLIILNFSLFIYENNMHVFLWGGEIWTYFALPFELILPLFILTVALLKNKRKATIK